MVTRHPNVLKASMNFRDSALIEGTIRSTVALPSVTIGLTMFRVMTRNMTRYYRCSVGVAFVQVTRVLSRAVGIVVMVYTVVDLHMLRRPDVVTSDASVTMVMSTRPAF